LQYSVFYFDITPEDKRNFQKFEIGRFLLDKRPKSRNITFFSEQGYKNTLFKIILDNLIFINILIQVFPIPLILFLLMNILKKCCFAKFICFYFVPEFSNSRLLLFRK